MRIGYIAPSTFYAVPFSVGSRWRGNVSTAHVVDAWFSLHDSHSFIINHSHLPAVSVFFKLTSLSK